MNTIFICIIFLLLGILLASLIFPNKCKEGMYFEAGGGTNCQGLLDTPVEVRAQMEAGPLGVACGSELRTGYNTNRAELCTGDGSLIGDQIATLSRVSGISPQDLNNCNSGSGTDEEFVEDESRKDENSENSGVIKRVISDRAGRVDVISQKANTNQGDQDRRSMEPIPVPANTVGWRASDTMHISACSSKNGVSLDNGPVCLEALKTFIGAQRAPASDRCAATTWGLNNPPENPILNADLLNSVMYSGRGSGVGSLFGGYLDPPTTNNSLSYTNKCSTYVDDTLPDPQ